MIENKIKGSQKQIMSLKNSPMLPTRATVLQGQGMSQMMLMTPYEPTHKLL